MNINTEYLFFNTNVHAVCMTPLLYQSKNASIGSHVFHSRLQRSAQRERKLWLPVHPWPSREKKKKSLVKRRKEHACAYIMKKKKKVGKKMKKEKSMRINMENKNWSVKNEEKSMRINNGKQKNTQNGTAGVQRLIIMHKTGAKYIKNTTRPSGTDLREKSIAREGILKTLIRSPREGESHNTAHQ